MSRPPDAIAASAERFIYHEAALLDAGDLAAWQALFAEDGLYWIPARREPSDPARHVSIVYDDPARLRLRVDRLLSGKEYAQLPPSVTARQITNLRIDEAAAGEVDVNAVMVVYEKRPTTPLQIIPTHTSWRLRPVPDGWRIVAKTVVLVDVHHHFENLTFIL